MSQILLTETFLRIGEFECADPDVVDFFTNIPESGRADAVCRALALGVVGLRAMGVAGHVELVEREFLKLSQRFDALLGGVETNLLDRVSETFDPDHAESVSARLSTSIKGAHAEAAEVVALAREELATLIADSFNPDLATSCVFRVSKLVVDTQAALERAFDPAYEGSHLSKLGQLVDSYFGADGTVSELVANEISPIKTELLHALQGVRELIVGQAMAADERDRAPASGLDFEDEVEAVLCRLGASYGDSVECVGTQAGDTGRSKRGDFVVQLSEGTRFVVEAKKRATPLPLRGDRGVLAVLDESMVNRAATFAIAVAKDHSAFAKEVGSFNAYDANKVLCCLGEGGELLEVAYRWARTALLAAQATHEGIDISLVEAALDEARRAIRELARIEAKVKSISRTADDIQSLLGFQVRRVTAALDEATTALSYPEELAS